MQRPGLLAALLLLPAVGGGLVAAEGLMAQASAEREPFPAKPMAQGSPQATSQTTTPGLAQAPASTMGGTGGLAAAPTRGHRGSVGCLIGAERTADIGSPVTGIISAIRVDRGDNVKRGQTLVTLEQGVEKANLQAVGARNEIEAEVRSAEANHALAKDRFERMSSLADSGAVAALTIEQARAEQDVAEQRVQLARGQRRVVQHELGVAQAQLAQRSLRAPFDGVVVERLSHEGERVEDKPLLRLAQLDPLRVELVMPAARWGSVKRGDAMALVADLPGAGRMLAKVTHIDRTLDAASNTFRVRLSLPNPDLQIPAGARCKLGPGNEAAPAAPQSNPGPAPGPQISRGPLLSPGGATPAAAPGAATLQPAAWVARGSKARVSAAQSNAAEVMGSLSLSRPRLRLTI